MTSKEKYKELLDLLDYLGVLQDDSDWAYEIQEMIEHHKKGESYEYD